VIVTQKYLGWGIGGYLCLSSQEQFPSFLSLFPILIRSAEFRWCGAQH